jgi:hypothetical protein
VTLWALFASAAIVAWRATTRRRDDVRLLEAIVNGSTDGVFRQGSRGPVPASAALAGLAPQHNVPGCVDDREALAGLRRDQVADLLLPRRVAELIDADRRARRARGEQAVRVLRSG